jgi:hypothetical protein
MIEIVIGYDARVFRPAEENSKSDLPRYSVDRNIWDSIFDLPNTVSLAPSFVGPNSRLWQDWEALVVAAESARLAQGVAISLIAVTGVSLTNSGIEHVPARQQFDTIKPMQHLGYDVGDYYLSSCFGMSLPPTYNASLGDDGRNQFGLFTNREEALRSAKMCEAMVPEHSPFFVYGVYQALTGS